MSHWISVQKAFTNLRNPEIKSKVFCGKKSAQSSVRLNSLLLPHTNMSLRGHRTICKHETAYKKTQPTSQYYDI